jgi:hypothetical protein
VLLTTGEKPVASFTQAGGTHARVLELWGGPFGEKSKVTGATVRTLNRSIKRNYGHAGPAFVRFLLKKREQWKEWRTDYVNLVKQYEDKAGDNAFAGRLADHFAAIRLTAQRVHEAIELPWKYADPIKPLWNELVREAGQADRSAAALRYVMAWAVAHQADFYHKRAGDDEHRQPSGGWAGVWPPEKVTVPVPGNNKPATWAFIGFVPKKLESVLADGGFDMEATVRTWQGRKWLEVTKDEGVVRTRLKVKIGSRSGWVIAIKHQAVDEAEAG